MNGARAQSKFKNWSTWCPWRLDIPTDDAEADKVLEQTLVEYALAGGQKRRKVLRIVIDTEFGVGKAVKPIDDSDVNCGMCQFVCWESLAERLENGKYLRTSGFVESDDEGNLVIVRTAKGN